MKIKVRNPPNSLFDCVWVGKTYFYIYMFDLEFKNPFFFDYDRF